jgi:Fe-S cluster biosynthesis and repair protein YggX
MSLQNNTFYSIDTILDSINREDVNNSKLEERVNLEECVNPEERVDLLEKEDNSKKDETNELPNVIYRFKFTQEFMEELYEFSKIHQYDERKDFKEAWKVWTEDNNELINEETTRLINLGYPEGGDVLDKMFKSARYYFRKKSPIKVEPKQRRPYINVTHDILAAMDAHITLSIGAPDYQPKNGFVSFCINNETILKQTISKIFEQGIKDAATIQEKLKKTYKNRYFLLTNKK